MSTVKSVVHIHGGGYAPLLVALGLRSAFSALTRSISVSLSPIVQPARALTTFSDMGMFNRQLKISEQSFIKSCRASFHLATKYSGVSESQYFSESDYGAMWERTQFHQLYHVYRAANQCAYDEFNLAVLLAKKNSFARPSIQKGFPFSALKYGYQLDEALYFQTLLALVKALGIHVYQSQVDAVDMRAGQLHSIAMSGGVQQCAEIFIDCSATRDIAQYTHPAVLAISALPSWQRQYVHVAAEVQDLPSASQLQFDQAHETITKMASLRTGQYQSVFRFSPTNGFSAVANHLPESWCGNSVALGEASAQLPNLLIDQSYLLQRQLSKLMAMGALSDAGEGIRRLFNRACEQDLEQLVDIDNLHIAHLLADRRLLTARNQQRLALFESAGSFYEMDSAILSAKQWLALLIVMGYKQQAAGVDVLRLSPTRINQQLTALRASMMRASEQSDSHQQWLAKAGV